MDIPFFMHSSQLRQKFTWLIAFIWTVSSCKNYCWCISLFELRVILVKKRCTVFMFQPTISILVTYFWSAQVTWLDRTCLFAKALVCPSRFFSFFLFPSSLYIQISMLCIALMLNIILLQKLLSLWAQRCLKYYQFKKLSQTSWTGSDQPEAERWLHIL